MRINELTFRYTLLHDNIYKKILYLKLFDIYKISLKYKHNIKRRVPLLSTGKCLLLIQLILFFTFFLMKTYLYDAFWREIIS